MVYMTDILDGIMSICMKDKQQNEIYLLTERRNNYV